MSKTVKSILVVLLSICGMVGCLNLAYADVDSYYGDPNGSFSDMPVGSSFGYNENFYDSLGYFHEVNNNKPSAFASLYPQGLSVVHDNQNQLVEINWEEVPGAINYVVRIKNSFYSVYQEQYSVELVRNNSCSTRLPVGCYDIRVYAVDAEGVKSRASVRDRFVVAPQPFSEGKSGFSVDVYTEREDRCWSFAAKSTYITFNFDPNKYIPDPLSENTTVVGFEVRAVWIDADGKRVKEYDIDPISLVELSDGEEDYLVEVPKYGVALGQLVFEMRVIVDGHNSTVCSAWERVADITLDNEDIREGNTNSLQPIYLNNDPSNSKKGCFLSTLGF